MNLHTLEYQHRPKPREFQYVWVDGYMFLTDQPELYVGLKIKPKGYLEMWEIKRGARRLWNRLRPWWL